MTEPLVSVGYGDVLIQVDENYTQRIALVFDNLLVQGNRVTITLPRGNGTADIAHAAIEVLDAVDGIEADKLTERIPDA